MSTVVICLPGSEEIGRSLAELIGAEPVDLDTRRFPDGETYVRLDQSIAGKHVIFASSLDRPDEKFLRLVFACATARDLQAASIGLVAPYLSYMRQDRAFNPGEGVTARYFAKTLSPWLDWLVTVDPHLHRIHSLSEVYAAPASVAHAAPAIARWIAREIADPIVIGPDQESEQWIREIADLAGAPHIALRKERRGDRDVQITIPELSKWHERDPVIVDDIISTAQSMIETIGGIKAAFKAKPVCVGVHAVFSGDALERLKECGTDRVVTCNTIRHETNEIDITGALAKCVREWIP
jgi:ribose-phosphate pyrophosphokinase